MDSVRSRPSASQSGGLGIASTRGIGSGGAAPDTASVGSSSTAGGIPVPRRSGTVKGLLGAGAGSQQAAPPPPPVVSKPLPEVHILGEIAGGSGFASGNGGTLGSGSGAPVCCKFSFETGDKWEWLGGHRTGQTHTVHPESGSDFSVWSHPVDVHYAAGAISVSVAVGIFQLTARSTDADENGQRAPFDSMCLNYFSRAGLAKAISASVGAGSFWQAGTYRVRVCSRARCSRLVEAARRRDDELQCYLLSSPSLLYIVLYSLLAGMHEVECPVWRPLGTDSQEAASFFLGANPILKSSAVVYGNAAERFRLVTAGTGTVHVRFEIIFRNMEAYGVEW
jgi:Ciliary basal body-associated, B9 protein